MYFNQQISDQRDILIAHSMSEAIYSLEERAAERHGRITPDVHEAVFGRTCPKCGHVGCMKSLP